MTLAGIVEATSKVFIELDLMPHLVLLGDSIFDNSAYVAGRPDVIKQLQAMLPPDQHHASAPCIGLFWFIPSGRSFRLAGKSRPLNCIATIGGMKTLDDGHPEVWKTLINRDHSLRRYEYEFFPRGRVNWIEDGNEFLVLADPLVFSRKLEEVVVSRFQLANCNVRFLTDLHYQTNHLPTVLA